MKKSQKKAGITKEVIYHAREMILASNQYPLEEQEYERWFRKLKRAINYGNLKDYKECMQTPYENKNYVVRFENECNGDNFLHNACLNGRTLLVQYLLENGWSKHVNVPNKNGFTPFLLAAQNRILNSNADAKILFLLVKHGADVFFIHNNGLSAKKFLEIAIAQNSPIHPALNKLMTFKEQERSLVWFLYVKKFGQKGDLLSLPSKFDSGIISYLVPGDS